MCGIVGYVGPQPAADVLLSGLKRLEYRGYDSAGLATLGPSGFELRRTVGRVAQLADLIRAAPVSGRVGIAHTRWATHGPPTEANAHPHLDHTCRFALVHNGVVENHASLRTFLQRQGIPFRSETDTEVLVQLVSYFYELGSPSAPPAPPERDALDRVRHALCRALQEVQGSFGIALICTEIPRTVLAARRGSAVIVGVGAEEFVMASDAAAIAPLTSRVTYLDDNEVVSVGSGGLVTARIDSLRPLAVERVFDTLELTLEEIELGGYPHHMLKEIHEQPQSLENTLRGRIQPPSDRVRLGGLATHEHELARCRRALLFGCGTAWHAALIGKYVLEELGRLPSVVEYASELRYRNPIIEEGTLAIAVSQSGETADTLAALQEVQLKGAATLGVVNVVGSSIARATDFGVYLRVGPEIGVASTKAFTAQVAVLAMIAADLGRRRQLPAETAREFIAHLARIPQLIRRALELEDDIQRLAGRLAEWDNWLYLGRGVNFPVALEGALKLKEISYIHAEGLPAAEMKHGPIAMIDPHMPVVVIAPRDRTYDKILANMEEVRSRAGQVIAIATEGDDEVARIADHVLYVPETLPLLSPLVTSVPLQLLAYYTAVVRGRDVDKPRNLAKSVTVE